MKEGVVSKRNREYPCPRLCRGSAEKSKNFKSNFSETSRREGNIMPIVPDSQRKNAFSHRLKDKRERSSDNHAGMTADQMKIAEKEYRDASLWMFNLSVAIRYPSSEQVKMMNEWIDELTEKIKGIRYNGSKGCLPERRRQERDLSLLDPAL